MSPSLLTAARAIAPCPAKEASRRRHVEMLVIAGLAIIASFILEVGPSDRVHVAGWAGYPVPKTCLSHEIFGVDCPGCGLTRSFVYLAHFRWAEAWQMHRLGWLLFLATAAQVPYRLQALSSPRGSIIPPSLSRAFGTVLIALLISNWVAGIILQLP
jgi:hypothetical protein